MVCPIEKVTPRMVHGVPHGALYREGYFMVCPIETVTLWVVQGVPHREGCSMGGP